MSVDQTARLALVVAELRRREQARFYTIFPDTGPYARHLYEKHLEFFEAGSEFSERLFMAGNRVGKTRAGAYELTCHLTGEYPSWWAGARFETPGEWWACGTTNTTTRDIVQAELVGKLGEPGTGMIPSWLILSTTPARGIPGALESVSVQHVSGGVAVANFKSYEQGRKSFEGTSKQGVWDDEEPPEDVYKEQLLRTMTTSGLMLTTFTPMQGRSRVVMGFLEPTEEAREVKYVVQAGWKDVPHLDPAEQKRIMASLSPAEIKARTEGEPTLGAGVIYPIHESEFTVPTRTISDTWRRVYAFDPGWNRTAIVWGAIDPGNDGIELYDLHYRGMGEPASHAAAVQARGQWLTGVIDPAALGRVIDGRQVIDIYRALGLDLEEADNAVEAGITDVWNHLVTGRLRVQAHLVEWFREFRNYHRDEKGRLVKENDHLMDATRYLVRSGRAYARVRPRKAVHFDAPISGPGGWN